MRRLNNDLRAAAGDAKARPGTVHEALCCLPQAHGEGGAVGPDLTHANRDDRDYLLVNLVDPSAVIRKEYLELHRRHRDGRRVTGMITAQSPASITLADAKAETTTLNRDEIESLRESRRFAHAGGTVDAPEAAGAARPVRVPAGAESETLTSPEAGHDPIADRRRWLLAASSSPAAIAQTPHAASTRTG